MAVALFFLLGYIAKDRDSEYRTAKVDLYQTFVNDYLTVTHPLIFKIKACDLRINKI